MLFLIVKAGFSEKDCSVKIMGFIIIIIIIIIILKTPA